MKEENNGEVLITGSSRGIGKAIALYLAENGYDIVLHCSKNPQRLEELKKEILSKGVKVRTLAFDVANRDETQNVLEKDIEENGIYYGVVLNAGIAKDNPFPAMEDEEWDSVINTNLGGFYNVLRPLIMPLIQAKRGRIVVMSSISGQCGNRGQVNYSASKAGLIGATKALSIETAKRNITVNCVAPGVIETDMTAVLSDSVKENIHNQIPLKRMGSAKEVANLIYFLGSEESSYITGQVINIDG